MSHTPFPHISELNYFLEQSQSGILFLHPDTNFSHLSHTPFPHISEFVFLELRALWCALVYLTLERVDHPAAGVAGFGAAIGKTVAPDVRDRYGTFVGAVVDGRGEGSTLAEMTLEKVLKYAGMDQDKDRSPTETAVLSQSLRLVYLTMTILEEEEAVTKPAKEPKPFIPGTE